MYANTFKGHQTLFQSVSKIFTIPAPTDKICCRYFHKMLNFFSSPPFYSDYVKLPTEDTRPPRFKTTQNSTPFSKTLFCSRAGSCKRSQRLSHAELPCNL